MQPRGSVPAGDSRLENGEGRRREPSGAIRAFSRLESDKFTVTLLLLSSVCNSCLSISHRHLE